MRSRIKARSSALGVALIIEKTGINASNADDLSPALRHVQVAEQLVAGTRDMRRVASQVGSIIIQES